MGRLIGTILFLLCVGSCVALPIVERRNIRYETIEGTVKNIEVFGVTSNAWNGTSGNCRVAILTSRGQKTISPYWRDCAKVSIVDQVTVRRRTDDSMNAALNGGWDWKFD